MADAIREAGAEDLVEERYPLDGETQFLGRAATLAKEHGAAGIITDFLHSQTPPWRTRQALPEAVQLLRLAPTWSNPWAFAVGYGAAEALSEMIRQGAVRVRARVRARTFK